MALVHLPVHVFAMIVGFDNMDVAVLRLWQTGDANIIFLLRHGGCTRLRLTDNRTMIKDATIKCPVMVKQLLHLRTLDLSCHQTLDATSLPTNSKCQLSIRCQNAREVRAVHPDAHVQQTMFHGYHRLHATNMPLSFTHDHGTLTIHDYSNNQTCHYVLQSYDDTHVATFINVNNTPYHYATKLYIFIPPNMPTDVEYDETDFDYGGGPNEPLIAQQGWRVVFQEPRRSIIVTQIVPADDVECHVILRRVHAFHYVFDPWRNLPSDYFTQIHRFVRSYRLDSLNITPEQGWLYTFSRGITDRWTLAHIKKQARQYLKYRAI